MMHLRCYVAADDHKGRTMGLLVRKLRVFFAMLICLPMMAACSGALPPLAQMSASDVPPPYGLGPGDKVRVTVYGEEKINGEYLVGPDGAIALPLIGIVVARGHTVRDMQREVTRRLADGYLLDPRVSIDVLTYRPFYILGEVNRPGPYPATDALSVAQAVAIAGGYTYRANSTRVFIRRGDGKREETYPVRDNRPVWILPGDTVRVGERYF